MRSIRGRPRVGVILASEGGHPVQDRVLEESTGKLETEGIPKQDLDEETGHENG